MAAIGGDLLSQNNIIMTLRHGKEPVVTFHDVVLFFVSNI